MTHANSSGPAPGGPARSEADQRTDAGADRLPEPGDPASTARGLGESVARLASRLGFEDSAASFNGLLLSLAPPLEPPPMQARPASAGHAGGHAGGVGAANRPGLVEQEVRACLARIAASSIGSLAWRQIDPEQALEAARERDRALVAGRVRGPLHGEPIGLKDLLDRRGHRAGWGSPLRDDAPVATRDATLVERLEAAGAVIVGTQHMAEFAMSPTGLNVWHGHGLNPRDPARVSGGSSSGAGMSVGAGHVRIAIGSDTGGSIRLPAALCGVSGLKPTQHRVSVAGAMPLAPSLDCLGPLAASVELCASAFVAIAGADPRDPSCLALGAPQPFPISGPEVAAGAAVRLRVAVPRLVAGDHVSAEMANAHAQAARALRDAGIDCIEVALPDLDEAGRLGSVLLAVESAALHRRWLLAPGSDPASTYGAQVRRRLDRGPHLSGIDYLDALRLRGPILADFCARWLENADALMLPTAPDVAPRLVDTIGHDEARLERELGRLSYWTRGINYLGLPALAVPAGRGASNLPLGVQLIGRPLAELQLLGIGQRFQQQTRWHLSASGGTG